MAGKTRKEELEELIKKNEERLNASDATEAVKEAAKKAILQNKAELEALSETPGRLDSRIRSFTRNLWDLSERVNDQGWTPALRKELNETLKEEHTRIQALLDNPAPVGGYRRTQGQKDALKEAQKLADNLAYWAQNPTATNARITPDKVANVGNILMLEMVQDLGKLNTLVDKNVDTMGNKIWVPSHLQRLDEIGERRASLEEDLKNKLILPQQAQSVANIRAMNDRMYNWAREKPGPSGGVSKDDIEALEFSLKGNQEILALGNKVLKLNNEVGGAKFTDIQQAAHRLKKLSDDTEKGTKWDTKTLKELEELRLLKVDIRNNAAPIHEEKAKKFEELFDGLWNLSPNQKNADLQKFGKAVTANDVTRLLTSLSKSKIVWEPAEKATLATLKAEHEAKTAGKYLSQGQSETLAEIGKWIAQLETHSKGENGSSLLLETATLRDSLKNTMIRATQANSGPVGGGATNTGGATNPGGAGGGGGGGGGGTTTPKPPLTEAEKAALLARQAEIEEENKFRREFNRRVAEEKARNSPTAAQMFDNFVGGTKGTISGITNGLLNTFANTGSESDKTIRSAVGVAGSMLEGITSIFGTMATSTDRGAQGLVKMLGMGGGFALGATLIPKVIGAIPILGGILNFGGLSSLAGGALGALIAYYGVTKIQPPSEPTPHTVLTATGGAYLPSSTSGFLGGEPVERPAVIAPVSVPAVEKTSSPNPATTSPEPAPRSPGGPLIFPSFEPEPEPKKEASLRYREGGGINFRTIDLQSFNGGLPAKGIMGLDGAVMAMVNTHALDRANGPIEVVGQERGGSHVGVDALFGTSPTSMFYTPPASIETVRHGTGNQVVFNRAVKRTLQDLKKAFTPAQTMQPAFDLG